MVGTHHTCCECFDEGVCTEGCCIGTGDYSGSGCPETYNVNITLSEVCFSCLDSSAGCADWCIPAMDLNFTILTSCGDCPEMPAQDWCDFQTVYACQGTTRSPCVPRTTCLSGDCQYSRPGSVINTGFLMRYRAGSYYFPPEEGRIRMEFEVRATYGYGGVSGFTWYLRMDKPAPNCLDWTLDDAGINIWSCNNCPVSYYGKEPIPCKHCNQANPSDPNYFGCCYQCAGIDCCEGCTIEHGGLMPNNWGRTGDMPTYPRTWSTPAILGFTIT